MRPLTADIQLSALFSDNMVLQRDLPISIWGTADSGEKITITIGNRTANTLSDSKNQWLLKLDPLKSGGPFEMIVQGKNHIVLHNILIGEVWLCSGQSNMEMKVFEALNSEEEIPKATYPKIRMFTTGRMISPNPQQRCQGSWMVCSPNTAPKFSAVGYFFGRELYQKLNVPIGLINSSWGGTPIEAWMDRSTFLANPDLKPITDRLDQTLINYEKGLLEPSKDKSLEINTWGKVVEKNRLEGKPIPAPPMLTREDPLNNQTTPTVLFNGMVAPLIPYTIRGIIWYQGESNAARAYQYRKLFPAMIQGWRKAWKRTEMPFLFVQLANFMPLQIEPTEGTWAELREAQLMTLSVPNTAMAVAIDLGDAKELHPKNKRDVGYRLALAARQTVYDEEIVHSGPIYQKMQIEENKVRLNFKHTDGGLWTNGNGKIKGFTIAGEDQKFEWAKAKIDGDTVIVWHPKISHPTAVRYAWADNPICNLYNKAGLPASPFRTDGWPCLTTNKK